MTSIIELLPNMLLRQGFRFAISGLLVTMLHVLIATALIQTVLAKPPIANGVAFIAATIVSYFVNTKWSFSSPLRQKNFIRFCVVSCIGCLLAITVSGAAQYYGLHYWYGISFVVFTVPPVTFLLHSFWTYQ
jgi:putative flippase GtrA